MNNILFGGGGGRTMLLLLLMPASLSSVGQPVPAFSDLAGLHPRSSAEKSSKSENGDQFYDLPQLKDFGLTKTPGHTMSPLIRFPN